eukprot:scaffold326952_cov41-Prasinocladus_malaysianus.AAC.1
MLQAAAIDNGNAAFLHWWILAYAVYTFPSQGSVSEMYLPHPPSVVVTNPPWGQRLENDEAQPQRGKRVDDQNLREVTSYTSYV